MVRKIFVFSIFSSTQTRNLKKISTGLFLEVAIHIHPGHSQPKMAYTNFFALVKQLLIKLVRCNFMTSDFFFVVVFFFVFFF